MYVYDSICHSHLEFQSPLRLQVLMERMANTSESVGLRTPVTQPDERLGALPRWAVAIAARAEEDTLPQLVARGVCGSSEVPALPGRTLLIRQRAS